MELLVIVGLVALTSVGAYIVGTRILALERVTLRLALGEALECLGLTVVFLIVNLAAGLTSIFGFRALTGRFVSVYWLNDVSLAVLSLLQALVFHRWWRPTK